VWLFELVNKERRESENLRIREYYWKNPDAWERRKRVSRDLAKNQRHQALTIVSGLEKPICTNCGCSIIDILEIDHKLGTGGGLRKGDHRLGPSFYVSIVKGRRNTSDLQVLCRVCNILHYVETKWPLLARGRFKVLFSEGNEAV
jgi:hypothetical protein